MPFTVAHAAAALPFRRSRLIPSALVVGTIAPDLEYFIRLRPGGGYGHTLPGMFLLSLPMAVVTLWMFHRFVKRPFILLLPDALQSRLLRQCCSFKFSGVGRFALICGSALVGIATHLLWDSFTHKNSWFAERFPIMTTTIDLPYGRHISYCGILQQLSSLFGCLVLLLFILSWYRSVRPTDEPVHVPISSGQRRMIVLSIIAVSLFGGLVRAIIGGGITPHWFSINITFGEGFVTAVALAWWQLILYGLLVARRVHTDAQVPV